MGLTADDLGKIKEIVIGAVAASEERMEERMDSIDAAIRGSEGRLHGQMVTLGDRLDRRIDETHVRIDALRVEVARDIADLAHSIQLQTNEIQGWHRDHERRIIRLEQRG